MKPDAQTLERIRNLAYVGKAISEISNDIQFETNYYLAMESLNKFEEGIMALELDYTTKEGMKALITYLRKKIQKRLNQSTGKAS